MAITHLVARTDYRRMPWKNGGGETVEIAKFPDNADLAGFDWRISMATVASDGPFSLFPGIDRTLAVLEGEGIDLAIDGLGAHHLAVDGTPLAFPADVASSARLVSGPIVDLNLMTRRWAFLHKMKRLPLPLETSGTDNAEVFLLVRGTGKAESGGVRYHLEDTDALHLASCADRVRLSGDGFAYRMEIRPFARKSA